MATRMSGSARRAQVLQIAAQEFAEHGLHGASTEAIAREAGITQAYVFRLFGTKRALFLELVEAAFDRVADGMRDSAASQATTTGDEPTGIPALTAMGAQYYDLLADRTGLLLQLQGLAACADPEVKAAVRTRFARMWDVVSDGTGLDPVTVKTFLAFGMLLNAGAALDVESDDSTTEDPAWQRGIRTRIRPGLFEHVTTRTNVDPQR